MKDFEAGFVMGVLFSVLGLLLVAGFTDITYTYKEDTSQAVELCRDGDWIKLDNTTIYCKDGAEYKLED